VEGTRDTDQKYGQVTKKVRLSLSSKARVSCIGKERRTVGGGGKTGGVNTEFAHLRCDSINGQNK
jgi:hypothetical protein